MDTFVDELPFIKERIFDYYRLFATECEDPWTSALMSVTMEIFQTETLGELSGAVGILNEILQPDPFLNELVN